MPACEHPKIPKRLAAKILRAQRRVETARNDILRDEDRIAQDEKRLLEYQADPVAFAKRYYGNNAPDSYPVQTNISRCEEGIERRQARKESLRDALRAADSELELTISGVLNEVQNLRRSAGRVPWPKPLPNFVDYRSTYFAELAITRKHEAYLLDQQLDQIRKQIDDQVIRDQEISEREFQVAKSEWEAERALMTAQQRAAVDEANQKIVDALQSGQITPLEIIKHLRERKL